MSGLKNEMVCSYLRKWLKDAKITQTKLSIELKVSQSLLSRQLLGKESIPMDRIEQIIAKTNPPEDEYKKVLDILSQKKIYSSLQLEMQKTLNELGPDTLLFELLQIWLELTIEERKTVREIIAAVNKRIDERDKVISPPKDAYYFNQLLSMFSREKAMRFMVLLVKLGVMPPLSIMEAKKVFGSALNLDLKDLVIEFLPFVPMDFVPDEVKRKLSKEDIKKIKESFCLENLVTLRAVLGKEKNSDPISEIDIKKAREIMERNRKQYDEFKNLGK